jgi:hypothetical protein
MKQLKTPEQLNEWLTSAQPRSQAEYYRGLLMRDRAFLDPALPVDPELVVARKMWALHVAGRVALVQKRNTDFDYSYRAQKIA